MPGDPTPGKIATPTKKTTRRAAVGYDDRPDRPHSLPCSGSSQPAAIRPQKPAGGDGRAFFQGRRDGSDLRHRRGALLRPGKARRTMPPPSRPRARMQDDPSAPDGEPPTSCQGLRASDPVQARIGPDLAAVPCRPAHGVRDPPDVSRSRRNAAGWPPPPPTGCAPRRDAGPRPHPRRPTARRWSLA